MLDFVGGSYLPMKSLIYDTVSRQTTFDGLNGKINLPNPLHPVLQSRNTKEFRFEAILGIVNLNSFSKCLLFCSESESQGKSIVENRSSEIFRVLKVGYVFLTDDVDEELADSIVNLLEALRFYYLFEEQDEHFLWNRTMLENFKEWAVNPYLDYGPVETPSIASFQSAQRSPFSKKINISEPDLLKRSYSIKDMMVSYLI